MCDPSASALPSSSGMSTILSFFACSANFLYLAAANFSISFHMNNSANIMPLFLSSFGVCRKSAWQVAEIDSTILPRNVFGVAFSAFSKLVGGRSKFFASILRAICLLPSIAVVVTELSHVSTYSDSNSYRTDAHNGHTAEAMACRLVSNPAADRCSRNHLESVCPHPQCTCQSNTYASPLVQTLQSATTCSRW